MRIIEKIEIKHFRSFDGGRKQEKVEVTEIKDLNIFSGANDSGKSNILRALNLFFNNEISPGLPFDLDRDLCKIQKERSDKTTAKKRKEQGKARQRDLLVKIKIHFITDGQGMLPEKFYVERTWDKNGLNPTRNSNIQMRYKNEKASTPTPNQKNALEGQLTQFIRKISFQYIPAIKDQRYFKHLFSELQNKLFEEKQKSTNSFSQESQKFNKLLKNETSLLFEEFKRNSGVDAQFDIPSTLIDFVNTLNIKTEHDISLFDRGDGIQARFIPDILNEISRDSKFVIWGFEEPENSYEDKNLRKLREEFSNHYSETKQIFLTTHSFNILSLKGDNISKFRVWKKDNTSLITNINENGTSNNLFNFGDSAKEKLEEELGIFELTEELEKVYKEKERQLCDIKNIREDLQKKLQDNNKPLMFSEDKHIQLYKLAWLILSDIPFEINNIDEKFNTNANFYIYPAEGATCLAGFLRTKNIDFWKDKKVVGLFDFDGTGTTQFENLKDNYNIVEGTKETGLYKKRTDHFIAMLLPVPLNHIPYIDIEYPSNYIELEHLLPETFLSNNSKYFEKVKQKALNGSEYFKAKDKKKAEIWKTCKNLTKDELINFKTLFNSLYRLWEINKKFN